MALTVVLDKLEDGVEIRDEGGRVREFIRHGWATGWWTTEPVTVEFAREAILNDPSMPQPGSFLDIDITSAKRYAFLTSRTVDIVDNNRAALTLNYVYMGNKADPWSVDTSLVQHTTLLDQSGSQVIITHNGAQQTAEWNVYVPTSRLTKEYARTAEAGETASSVANLFVGKINGFDWGPYKHRQCMVTAMNVSEVVEAPTANRVLKIGAEITVFRGSAITLPTAGFSGHQPVVYYKDADEGGPGTELVEGSGWKMITYYPEVQQAAWSNEFGSTP